MSPRRVRLVLPVLAALAALTALAGSAPPGPAATSGAAAAGALVGPRSGARVMAAGSGPVVLLGVPGLRWEDVSPRATPALWRLAAGGAIANIAVRGVRPRSCAADGWLTISAGDRAQPAGNRYGRDCAPPRPERAGGGAVVPGFAGLRAHNRTTPYSADVGLLGERVRGSGGCVAGVGPGGALAAADRRGRVGVYARSVAEMPRGGWSRCAVTVVDLDERADRPGGPTRATAARLDRRAAAVLDALPGGATILLVGVSDVRRPGLRVAIAGSPKGAPGGAYLTASSTRRPGLVTLTDVMPTVLSAAGVPVPGGLPGRPMRRDGPVARDSGIPKLVAADVAARTARRMVAPLAAALVAVQAIAYALALLAVRRERRSGRRAGRLRSAGRLLALAAAAAPVATYLVNLAPWWRSPHPALALAAGVLAADLLLVAAAVRGPWRRAALGPVVAVAAITALVLAGDALTGSRLQADSVNGNFSLVAGRFYGFGNLAFALFASAALLCAAGLAGALLGRGRRRTALALVLAVGGAALVIDGWPGWGSDVGGVIALAPGVAVLALAVGRRRVTPARLAALAGAGCAAVAVLAYVDHLRPADRRTHFGQFWQRLLDGDVAQILARKLDSMLHSGGGSVWLTLLAMLPLVAAFAALRGRARTPADPMLRAGLTAVLVMSVAGLAVNDSGVAVPAVAALFAVPLATAAALRAREPTSERA